MTVRTIGCVKEIKEDEDRVALAPSGVLSLVKAGHRVLFQSGAGLGSGITDGEYADAGAEIVLEARRVWEQSSIIVKVKEPLPVEYPLIGQNSAIFHAQNTPGVPGRFLFMRHQNNRASLIVQVLQNLHYGIARF